MQAQPLGLEHCKDLHTLDLSVNHIGADGTKALAVGLEHCKNFHTLDLHGVHHTEHQGIK